MKGDEIAKIVTEKFGDAVSVMAGAIDSTLAVQRESLLDVCRFCQSDARLAFDLLSCLSGVDWGDRLGAVYHLDSTTKNHWLVLKVDVSRDDPRIPTVTGLWPAANWHEREAFDLVGLVFEGHPNLRRILCAEDWAGHPLRKDYVMPDEYHGIPNDFKQAGKTAPAGKE